MAFTPNEKTIRFIEMVQNLVDNGVAPSYVDIANTIEWNTTAMSNVINKRRNVPNAVYKRFSDVYKPIEIKNLQALTAEKLIKIDVTAQVMLSALAEILAFQRNQTVARVSEDLVATVNLKLKQIAEK